MASKSAPHKETRSVTGLCCKPLVIDRNGGSTIDVVIDPLSIRRRKSYATMREAMAEFARGSKDRVEEVATRDLRAPTSTTVGGKRHGFAACRTERACDGRATRRARYARELLFKIPIALRSVENAHGMAPAIDQDQPRSAARIALSFRDHRIGSKPFT